MKGMLISIIGVSVFLSGCASLSHPVSLNYGSINLLYSDNLVDEADIYNGKAVFAVYLYGNPYSQGTLTRVSQSSIFIADSDGSNQKRITQGIGDRKPHWTKDGDIVFYRSLGNMRGWYLIDMEGDETKGMIQVSNSIAQSLIKKEFTAEHARTIKWR